MESRGTLEDPWPVEDNPRLGPTWSRRTLPQAPPLRACHLKRTIVDSTGSGGCRAGVGVDAVGQTSRGSLAQRCANSVGVKFWGRATFICSRGVVAEGTRCV